MSRASITWAGGPVLRARVEGPFHVFEALAIGERHLLGEVIQLRGDEIVAQVYEDTTGLEPGMTVEGRGRPLSVTLGPGLLGGIFDGLLRPLAGAADFEIRPGFAAPPPARFAVTFAASVGAVLEAGAAWGTIDTPRPQALLVPPAAQGRVEWLAAPGEHAADATLAVLLDAQGTRHELTMQQEWPVRRPRPVRERLGPHAPMITGQRILDTLFPVARGGRAALPGGFGTGKTVLQQALAKWCDADVIVYVGCGERGNEMAEVLREFPHLDDPRTGRPLARAHGDHREHLEHAGRRARSEHLHRDHGRRVLPRPGHERRADGGLDEPLGRGAARGVRPARRVARRSRLSRVPELTRSPSSTSAPRASTALCGREGSVTIIGAVSPPAGDFSEPVTMHTQRFVRSFWALDRQRAQARLLPGHPPAAVLRSEDAEALAGGGKQSGNPDWLAQRAARARRCSSSRRSSSAWCASSGADALPAAQQLTLAVRRTLQRRLPAAVVILAGRPVLLARAAGRDAAVPSAFHGSRRGRSSPRASRSSGSRRCRCCGD